MAQWGKLVQSAAFEAKLQMGVPLRQKSPTDFSDPSRDALVGACPPQPPATKQRQHPPGFCERGFGILRNSQVSKRQCS